MMCRTRTTTIRIKTSKTSKSHIQKSKVVNDKNVAQDILQEIYLSVYRNISSLKLDRLLIPWMRQITYHICCDYSKKARKNREISVDFTEGNPIADTASIAEEAFFQFVFDKDTLAVLDKLLLQFPQKEKQAFLLRYESDLKLEEVADFMDLSLATVKRYIKHVRDVLQEKLHSRTL